MPVCEICRKSYEESRWDENWALCSYGCWCKKNKTRLLVISIAVIILGIILYMVGPIAPIFPGTATLMGIVTVGFGLLGLGSSIYGYIR